jgi:hypothetical protein
MLRASSLLSVSAALALASMAQAIEPPVIVNGTAVAQAPRPEQAPPPADPKPPVINNWPSAAQTAPADNRKTDVKLPTITADVLAIKPAAAAPARVAVAYTAPVISEYMTPVAYNAYGVGPQLGLNAAYGYDMYSPFVGGYGYGGYGYAGYGYAGAYGPSLALAPTFYDFRPPRVEVLDTGVRPNVGHLTSLPSVREPVFGQVIGVYYR